MLPTVIFIWVTSCFVFPFRGETILVTSSNSGGVADLDPSSNLTRDRPADSDSGVGLLVHSGATYLETGLTSSVASRLTMEEREARLLDELLGFLMSTSTGRQLYLLHDHSSSVVSSAMVTSYQRWGQLIIVRYTSELEEMEATVRSHLDVLTLRDVFVVCSAAHTIHVFTEVRRRSLESAFVRWFVVLQEDVTQEILSTLREGTQVLAAVRGSEGLYHLLSSHVDNNNRVTLEDVGWWAWSPSDDHESFLSKPLHGELSLAYSDFGGRRLKAAVVDNEAFFEVTTTADGSIQPLSGIDFQVLNTLSQKLNFTYQLVLAEDRQWGGVQENGSVTGMIGLVARHQANLAINEITITTGREEVVDFTAPYFLESTTLISRAPEKKNQSFAVFSPFTLRVWLLVAAATLAMGPVLRVVAWLRQHYIQEARPQHSLQDFAFNMFRSLVVQGNLLLACHWEQRIVFFTWYFFCFTVYAMYAGTLTAFLAIPAYEKPIDSLWDLLNAVKHKNYKPVVVLGTSNEFIFKEAKRGIYRDLWQVFDHSEGYVDTYNDGMDKVLKGKYVFLNAQLGAEIRAVTRGRHKYYFARNAFYPQGYGIACTSGSPLRRVFDKILTQMSAAGLVQKWTRDEIMKAAKRDNDIATGPGAITLRHLQAAFFLLVLGYLLGGLALLLERIRHRRHATTLGHVGQTTIEMMKEKSKNREHMGKLSESEKYGDMNIEIN